MYFSQAAINYWEQQLGVYFREQELNLSPDPQITPLESVYKIRGTLILNDKPQWDKKDVT